ncbi:MAG: hypothetical protein ACRDDX_10415 [Cellulosilyticaceae bacterium]
MNQPIILGISALVDAFHDVVVDKVVDFKRANPEKDMTECEDYKQAKLITDMANLLNAYYGMEQYTLEDFMSIAGDNKDGCCEDRGCEDEGKSVQCETGSCKAEVS